MKISSITVKNIRGLENNTIKLNMIPNKPSLLVAPNGSGKSSFAIAFQSLIRGKIKLEKENFYLTNDRLLPEIEVKVDDNGTEYVYHADSSNNNISNNFGISVINNRVKPEVTRRRINNNSVSTVKMTIAPIVLEKVPNQESITFDFNNNYGVKLKRRIIPSINNLLKNHKFYRAFPIDQLDNIKTPLKSAEDAINKIKSCDQTKTVNEINAEISGKILPSLKAQPKLRLLADTIRCIIPTTSELNLYLMAVQLIVLYDKDKIRFKGRKEYAEYFERKQLYVSLFRSLKGTWQNILPKEQGEYLIVDIPNANFLSNGERDIIVFLAMLEKAKLTLTKDNNILIIDEVFDYLDDANLVAAQYYITKFIKDMKNSGKNLFPIILTHLNPEFYKNYAFKGMKVYYLVPIPKPEKSELMMQLLRKRNELMRATKDDKISKYMLHFYKDYSCDMSDVLNTKQVEAKWNDISNFKSYCKKQYDSYENNSDYCPISVCVILREWIESYCYARLAEDKKEGFFTEHGTQKKLSYAEENGVDYPEIFCLLGIIYNDSLHANDTTDLRQTLYSRLQNNTIKSMIKSVAEICQK